MRALKDYMAQEGGDFLPFSTSIPDLAVDSKSYVWPKAIYKARAESDLALIRGCAHKRLGKVEREGCR